MLLTPRAVRSLIPASTRRPLRACAILAAGLLPLSCADSETTAPAASRTDPAPAAAGMHLPPIFIEELTGRRPFTDQLALQTRLKLDGRATNVVNVSDPSNVLVLRITVQPGARFPWHTHPGPVFVSVDQGELVLTYADDCVQRRYAQAVFLDPGNSVHMAANPGPSEVVLIATFFGVPPAGPVTLALPAEQQTALDAQCGVTAAGVHTH